MKKQTADQKKKKAVFVSNRPEGRGLPQGKKRESFEKCLVVKKVQ